jgi:hypothetical protein
MAVEHRPSTTRERLLQSSREELAPHKSLEAVADAAVRVVSAVSVAAILVSGLGLVSAITLTDTGWGWALPTIILSAISVALAIWATVPSRQAVKPGDLEDVQRFFAGQIRKRGNLVRAAAISIGCAVLLTPLPALAAAFSSSPDVAFNVSAMPRGSTAVVTIEGEHLAKGTLVTVSWSSKLAHGALLTSDIGEGGSVNSSIYLPLATLGREMSLRLEATNKGRVVVDQVIPSPELDSIARMRQPHTLGTPP